MAPDGTPGPPPLAFIRSAAAPLLRTPHIIGGTIVEPRVSVVFRGNHSVITLERSAQAGARERVYELESRSRVAWHAKCLLEIVLPLRQTTMPNGSRSVVPFSVEPSETVGN